MTSRPYFECNFEQTATANWINQLRKCPRGQFAVPEDLSLFSFVVRGWVCALCFQLTKGKTRAAKFGWTVLWPTLKNIFHIKVCRLNFTSYIDTHKLSRVQISGQLVHLTMYLLADYVKFGKNPCCKIWMKCPMTDTHFDHKKFFRIKVWKTKKFLKVLQPEPTTCPNLRSIGASWRTPQVNPQKRKIFYRQNFTLVTVQ